MNVHFGIVRLVRIQEVMFRSVICVGLLSQQLSFCSVNSRFVTAHSEAGCFVGFARVILECCYCQ